MVEEYSPTAQLSQEEFKIAMLLGQHLSLEMRNAVDGMSVGHKY